MAGLARREARMNIEEFLQFAETRPDEEKWELFDGVPVMNASAVVHHQIIVGNLLRYFGDALEHRQTNLLVIPGIGFRVSDFSMPVPDVMILPPGDGAAHFCDDMVVAFEVLSPSTKKRDLTWKFKAYAGMEAVQHYVIVVPEKMEVLHFRRAAGWQELRLNANDAEIVLAELDIKVSLRDVYARLGY